MSQQLSWQERKRRINAWFGYVYVLKCGDHYKIGQSKRPRKRLTQLRTGSPHPIEVVHTLRTAHFRAIERTLHVKFRDKRGTGEWFALSDEDIEYIKSIDSMGRTPEQAREYEDSLNAQQAEYQAKQKAEEDRRAAILFSGAASGVGLCLAVD